MAAEGSTAWFTLSSYRQMGKKSRPWGAAEIQCTQCGRRVSRVSGEDVEGHHHELQCGHAFCELCLLITEEYSTIICPDCEVATTINMRQGYYPTDGCIKEDSFMEKLQPKKTKNCSQDFKKTSDQLTIGLEHATSTHRTILNSSSIMAETKTAEEIDEALKIAGYNFEQLNVAVKMLEHIHNQTKEETVSLIEVLEKQFDQLFTSLDSRKKNLCEEVVRNTDDYLSSVIMAKSYIEEKKNDLAAAMKIARELKSAPSLRTYCDLNQIIRTLKLTFESELLQVNSLKLRNSPRLNMNCSEIICMFNNMGKIEFERLTKCDPQENEVGQNIQKKYNHKKEFSCHDTYLLREKKKVDMSVLSNEASAPSLQREASDVHLEAEDFQPQKEVVAAPSPKTIAVLPQMESTPDVIIEEIIEENLESSPELVFVSHVIHPCHFYIRKYSQIKDATVLEKKVNQFCNKSLHLDPSDILELGARIFVNSIENGMWCRGTITELIPIESENIRKLCSSTRFSVHEVALIQIFMVDFGNSEVLIVAGVGDTYARSEHIAEQHIVLNDLCLVLRKSEPYIERLLKDIHPLALPCSLKDIVPQNSDVGWGEEAKVEFLKMVNNKAVLMKVFREEDGVLIVDLQKPPTNKISSDMPVSLRDALVFMELARFRSQSPRSLSEKNMTLHYHPPILPNEMTDVSVMVCHINSPTDFYLQLIESLDFLFLLKTIEEFYKSEDGENLEILCPVQGQACVAKFEDGVWYRAKVIGLPGHREVEVKYVDFGNTAKITLKEMRKIKDEFLNPPEKAIKCRLAYIEPCIRTKQWPKKAKEIFEEKTQDKFMTCSVVKILEDNVLLVELFDSLGAPGMTPTSVNDQLVKEGLASYEVGYTVKDNSRKHIEVWDPSPEEIISNEVNSLNPVSVKSLPNENLQSLYNKELPVHICNVISPEKIYVQWLLTENLLNSLEEKMVAAYENSKWEPIKWENDMHCAVKIPDKNQWRRGQIIRMVTDTLVEVLLYDVGVELVVNITCLRELQENLRTIGRLSLECALVDIRPTGGSDKWTATACDCLSLYLTGAVATIILQENNTTWPLPVKIFCRDEKGERVDVSKYLIKKGLALRERRIKKLSNSQSSSEKSLEISLEQEDSMVTKINFDPDKKAADVIKVSEFQQKIPKPRTTGCYKPPAIPNMKVFEAIVSCIGDDGTIFVVPKLSEFELIKMMNEIQSNLKCLGLLEPYFWKKGEACAVRGSDTMWYRGKVMEVVGGTIKVQYLDHGFTEKIPQCHLYPILLYPDTPQFCIPCQLCNTKPVGNVWQPDAVELLQELLSKREVEIHIMELPENPWEKVSIHLYFDGMSLSYFMAYHKYCTFEHSEEILKEKLTEYNKKYEDERWEIRFEELLLSETETPILPPYLPSSLPPPEELYAVQVKHVVSPNEVYICLDSVESCNLFNQHSDTDDSGVSWESESESLNEALRRFNKNVETFPPLTDFRTEMPCLAEYDDGLWYRAKIVSVKEFNPLAVLVQFVDYGSTEKLTINRLRQIPLHLMQYPARAIKVLLAGFKPPLRDPGKTRIPYCPKWSMEALWAMIDCLQGKQLYASSMAQAPEQIVTLYEDEQYPVHMSLVEMGLADRDE
ncbi:RING finger protein 17 isoform X1 [Canis lupus baileyi]|uniref:RING finger protein 17 isoform X1 n=1 Tax=Canis lupus dingo TaxID=286419 RepID=UPI000DC68388|nr:RING finger protein 17 isoform X1 [Canis lupus dingo]XP_038291063.1 RING finger protein 17 isoform X1 [Canis lupus familiaris]XP_038314254.1 RING finger protein 17 isoform X1 [Canis lupus familiaris]XP_038429473.1 RING finger protein 17 isoform X1 [Canis lupus familiaris]